jgi:2-methylcitrate dehydratase
MVDLINANPHLLSDRTGDAITKMVVVAYEPAFGIIGDPAKRDPKTRQSADHSMLFLVCTMLRKALEARAAGAKGELGFKELMLLPHDFDASALHHPVTRALMEKMTFEHGGPDYDAKYPDGIPTSMIITDKEGQSFDSGLVMYPTGHARNTTADLKGLLAHKWEKLGELASDKPKKIIQQLSGIATKSAAEVAKMYAFEIEDRGRFE